MNDVKPMPFPYAYDDLIRLHNPQKRGTVVMGKIKAIDRMSDPATFGVTTRDSQGWNLKFCTITENDIIKNFGCISYNEFKEKYPEYVL